MKGLIVPGPIRIYADTSVFGGVFDEEFSESSLRLFDRFREGEYCLVLSEATIDELVVAPSHVRDILASVPEEFREQAEECPAIEELRDAYLAAGIVGPASSMDAEHIASATVADVDMIVSWNFKHIVHFVKIRGYHGVNLIHGYRAIPIFSPPEVA